jgi:hypothetical protein
MPCSTILVSLFDRGHDGDEPCPSPSPPPSPAVAYEPPPNRKRWTRRECRFLVENGLLVGRYELIDGWVLSETGQNRRHAITIVLLNT